MTSDISRAALEKALSALAQAEKELSCRDALIKDHLTKILYLENRIDVETRRADELDDAVWLCHAGQDDLCKELDAAESALADEQEKVVHYVRGLNAIVNLQSYCTRAAIREFAHDILSGRTKALKMKAPPLQRQALQRPNATPPERKTRGLEKLWRRRNCACLGGTEAQTSLNLLTPPSPPHPRRARQTLQKHSTLTRNSPPPAPKAGGKG